MTTNAVMLTRICPKAPAGAQTAIESLGSNLVWLVVLGYVLATIACIGAIIAGRMLHMHRLNTSGWVGLLVVACAAIAQVAFPNILDSILGQGCVG